MVSQAWPGVLDAVKAKGRVAWLLIGNASVVSLHEGVLTLRFPRQGDVKGFQSSRYEDLLKQVLTGMFGINVVVRAISGTDAAPSAGRPGPGPVPHSTPTSPSPPPSAPAGPVSSSVPSSPPARSAGNGGGEATGPFGITGFSGGDLPPLPSDPTDDEEFDPDDEDMPAPVSNQLSGMALIQRELGAQVIGDHEG